MIRDQFRELIEHLERLAAARVLRVEWEAQPSAIRFLSCGSSSQPGFRRKAPSVHHKTAKLQKATGGVPVYSLSKQGKRFFFPLLL